MLTNDTTQDIQTEQNPVLNTSSAKPNLMVVPVVNPNTVLESSNTPAVTNPPVFTLNTTKLEATPKRRRGRLTNAERLGRDRDHSTGSLGNIFRNLSNKRSREPDSQISPPSKLKIRHPSSSPPSSGTANSAVKVSKASSTPKPIDMNTNECNSIPDLLGQLRKWRDEDNENLKRWQAEMKEDLQAVKDSNTELIKAARRDFEEEKVAVHAELSEIKSRLKELEKQPPSLSSGSPYLARSINKQITNSAISSVEKHLRKNNVIINGLEVANNDVYNTVDNFIATHFDLKNSITTATLIGKAGNRIKATFADTKLKNQVMQAKKQLKTSVFINHDLTPEEDFASRQIRDFGRSQRSKGKSVKYGHLRVYVDRIAYKYDVNTKSIVPASPNIPANPHRSTDDPAATQSDSSGSKNA